MDKLKRTKLMGVILSGGLAISGLSYADNAASTSATDTNSQNATTDQRTPQSSTMRDSTQTQTEQVVPDNELKSQVTAAMKEYAGKVEVKVASGEVSLSGQLESDTDYDKVITSAESVKGVQDVNVDNLTVKDSQRPLNDT